MRFLMLVCRDESIAFSPRSVGPSVPGFRLGYRSWSSAGCACTGTSWRPSMRQQCPCMRGQS